MFVKARFQHPRHCRSLAVDKLHRYLLAGLLAAIASVYEIKGVAGSGDASTREADRQIAQAEELAARSKRDRIAAEQQRLAAVRSEPGTNSGQLNEA